MIFARLGHWYLMLVSITLKTAVANSLLFEERQVMSSNSGNSSDPADLPTGGSPAPQGVVGRSIGWVLSHGIWAGIGAIATILALVVAIMQLTKPDGPPAETKVSDCSANGAGSANVRVDCSHTVNQGAPNPLSNDPRAQIVQLTGSWSTKGFVTAIVDRDTSIVGLYLQSGMKATTLQDGASAILYGFQGVASQNGDPVALVKTFQAAGFKIDDELHDGYLMHKLVDLFPLPFHTDLTPKGYTGGYQDGVFVGSLLFWIVQRAAGWGPTDQDIQVINYLISQGADCKVPLSFLNYNASPNSNTLGGTSPYEKLLPMMQNCAR
ncbi:hypothetical protein H7J83_17800 [Mycobacterium mantenii]|nr:hypothetical protein [Mycobacterium mantenii]MCV7244563.1 hypothetical protein [Mycobacterium mantenii]